MGKGKQSISCDVHSCKYCDCEEDSCTLKEIKVKNENGMATEKEETICASYKLDDDKIED